MRSTSWNKISREPMCMSTGGRSVRSMSIGQIRDPTCPMRRSIRSIVEANRVRDTGEKAWQRRELECAIFAAGSISSSGEMPTIAAGRPRPASITARATVNAR
jgi:hypothetical protein